MPTSWAMLSSGIKTVRSIFYCSLQNVSQSRNVFYDIFNVLGSEFFLFWFESDFFSENNYETRTNLLLEL